MSGSYTLHPDYYRTAIVGEFQERESIFAAFLEEMRQINEMAHLMGRPAFFRKTYGESERPRNFGFLIRPTLKEFNDFVSLLDKMLSDNINVDFFGEEITREDLETRPDGTVVSRPKGSIRILEEWIAKRIRLRDPQPAQELIASLKKVRKFRQHPAHAVDEDVFDQVYFKQQRELIVDAYGAVRTLRQLLANHPRVKGHRVPDWLYEGRIWTQ